MKHKNKINLYYLYKFHNRNTTNIKGARAFECVVVFFCVNKIILLPTIGNISTQLANWNAFLFDRRDAKMKLKSFIIN